MTNKPYSNLECPECDNKGDFILDDNGDVFCVHCGLVIESSYPYVAGFRFKTLSEILDDNRIEKFEDKRLRREYARIKKFQKV